MEVTKFLAEGKAENRVSAYFLNFYMVWLVQAYSLGVFLHRSVICIKSTNVAKFCPCQDIFQSFFSIED